MTRFQFLSCAAIALSTAVSAQNAPKPITRTDYLKIVDGHFNGADTNHDGFMSKAELIAQQQHDVESAKANLIKKLQEAFARLDTNHDGKLTLQEFLATAGPIKTTETPDQMIARLDSNHDGKVSADEYRNPELAKFNKVDANHDGVVTPQEVQAAQGK